MVAVPGGIGREVGSGRQCKGSVHCRRQRKRLLVNACNDYALAFDGQTKTISPSLSVAQNQAIITQIICKLT